MVRVRRHADGFLITVQNMRGSRELAIKASAPHLATWLNDHPLKHDPRAPVCLTATCPARPLTWTDVAMILKQAARRAGRRSRRRQFSSALSAGSATSGHNPLKAPGPKAFHMSMIKRQSPGSDKAGSASTVHLVCPGCYAEYQSGEPVIFSGVPICPDCSLPLLRSPANRKHLKCLRCVHRAVVPEGIWCRHHNQTATAELATGCRHSAARCRRRSRAEGGT